MTINVIVSDTHINSTVGLCPPYVELDDGGTYRASSAQHWLWSCWTNFVARVTALRDELNQPVITIINGDLGDGDHHGTFQIVSKNPATQLRMAHATLSPLLGISDRVFVIRGTRAHSGGSGNFEEIFAADLDHHVPDPENNTASWWRLLLERDGVLMDIAHHNTMGRLPWTVRKAAISLATKTLFAYADQKPRQRVPDLVIRSHRHLYADSYKAHIVRAICTPSWQLATEYVHQISPDALSDVGGIVIITEDKQYEVIDYLYPRKTRKITRIDL